MPIGLKTAFKASLLDAQHERDTIEKNRASTLVVSLVKVRHGESPSDRQGGVGVKQSIGRGGPSLAIDFQTTMSSNA